MNLDKYLNIFGGCEECFFPLLYYIIVTLPKMDLLNLNITGSTQYGPGRIDTKNLASH